MIKDKITPELKAKFLQEVNKTIIDGNEHGFLICHDNNGKLSPSKASIGEKDNINFINIKDQCPFKIQGDFHTHASVSDVRNFIKEKIPEEKVSDDVVKDITMKLYKENGITTTTPSHGDLLGLLVLKGKDKIIGTVCMSSDAEPNNVECWTIKDNVNGDHYKRANIEIKNRKLIRNPPHNWIKPLFNKEIINLDRS
jgi:hypothetical protein